MRLSYKSLTCLLIEVYRGRMWQRAPRIFLLFLPFFLPVLMTTAAVAEVRVACVGDSITYGLKLTDRRRDSYPSQLGRLLGSGYTVRNYGYSGATMLKSGDKPYWNTSEYTQSTNWKPNLVVIMLGTNDAKPKNWRYKSNFEGNYKEMIGHYGKLSSSPKVYISLPPHIYNDTLRNDNLENQVLPLIVKVGMETGTPVIDVNASTRNHPEWFPDGIHPNAQGSSVIANVVYNSRWFPLSMLLDRTRRTHFRAASILAS